MDNRPTPTHTIHFVPLVSTEIVSVPLPAPVYAVASFDWVMSEDEATAICGSLSDTTKMPGMSYSIPATACITGRELRKVVGSVCNKCYAMKGHYSFPVVKKALQRRLDSLDHPQWVVAIASLIHLSDHAHFRWHDSGDVQSAKHLMNIIHVAQLLPHIRFWLPTREKWVCDYLTKFRIPIPDNMVVRMSTAMVNGTPPTYWPNTSQVTTYTDTATCPAPQQGNKCAQCRSCWDKNVACVSYALH